MNFTLAFEKKELIATFYLHIGWSQSEDFTTFPAVLENPAVLV